MLEILIIAALLGFQVWMLIDAVRRQQWIWTLLIFLFSPISALIYFVLVYRPAQAPGSGETEDPRIGSDAERIQELRNEIENLDKAHHHQELGEIYHRHGDLDQAEACYRAAYERDPDDLDIQTRLAECLNQKNRFNEARSLYEGVCRANPRHEYGHSLMALAETYSRLADPQRAIETWKRVLEDHNYDRARVRLAELYSSQNQPEQARSLLQEVLSDDTGLPEFAKQRQQPWTERAQKLLRKLS